MDNMTYIIIYLFQKSHTWLSENITSYHSFTITHNENPFSFIIFCFNHCFPSNFWNTNHIESIKIPMNHTNTTIMTCDWVPQDHLVEWCILSFDLMLHKSMNKKRQESPRWKWNQQSLETEDPKQMYIHDSQSEDQWIYCSGFVGLELLKDNQKPYHSIVE